jgi:hypothetical protein
MEKNKESSAPRRLSSPLSISILLSLLILAVLFLTLSLTVFQKPKESSEVTAIPPFNTSLNATYYNPNDTMTVDPFNNTNGDFADAFNASAPSDPTANAAEPGQTGVNGDTTTTSTQDGDNEALYPTAWPDLVGMDANEARDIILASNPNVKSVEIVSQDDFVTADYITSRVRLFVDEENVIVQIPIIG